MKKFDKLLIKQCFGGEDTFTPRECRQAVREWLTEIHQQGIVASLCSAKYFVVSIRDVVFFEPIFILTHLYCIMVFIYMNSIIRTSQYK